MFALVTLHGHSLPPVISVQLVKLYVCQLFLLSFVSVLMTGWILLSLQSTQLQFNPYRHTDHKKDRSTSYSNMSTILAEGYLADIESEGEQQPLSIRPHSQHHSRHSGSMKELRRKRYHRCEQRLLVQCENAATNDSVSLSNASDWFQLRQLIVDELTKPQSIRSLQSSLLSLCPYQQCRCDEFFNHNSDAMSTSPVTGYLTPSSLMLQSSSSSSHRYGLTLTQLCFRIVERMDVVRRVIQQMILEEMIEMQCPDDKRSTTVYRMKTNPHDDEGYV